MGCFMSIKFTLLIVISLLFISSCAIGYKSNYSLVKPIKSDTLAYTDSNFSIIFLIHNSHFNILLTNSSDSELILKWDEMSFIDSDNYAYRVVKGSTRVINDGFVQPDFIIPPSCIIETSLFPVPQMYVRPDLYIKSQYQTKEYLNKNIGLYMPIYQNGKRVVYFFRFNIDSFETIYSVTAIK